MKIFRAHLQEKLREERFEELFDDEKELVRIGIEVAETGPKRGISRADLAEYAHGHAATGSKSGERGEPQRAHPVEGLPGT